MLRNFENKRYILGLALICFIYFFITIISLNHCYFWDNIQQTSKEAYWYYSNNFSSILLPGFGQNSEITGSGYHPPLTGIITAFLWKIFGMHLWVSHIFILGWSLLLAYHSYKLFTKILPPEIASMAMLISLLDSTVLSQIAMASPDVILLTSFVMAFRFILDKQKLYLTIALLFLGLVNGRGMFTMFLLFIFNILDEMFDNNEKVSFSQLAKTTVPFLPAISLLLCYFVLYFSQNGWFFSNPQSPWKAGWESPEGMMEYLKNILSFGLRLLENGRFFIWTLLTISLVISIKRHLRLNKREVSLGILTAMFILLYLYFALTTKIVIASRYYMPMFTVLVLFTFTLLSKLLAIKRLKLISGIAILLLITGNLWTYPDKIAKAWDSTLNHLSFYELRQQCFDYIEINHINTEDIGSGFCLSGNQRYIDLKDRDLRIEGSTDKRYFLYSNISNIEDDQILEFENPSKWKTIKTFKEGYVFIKLMEKAN